MKKTLIALAAVAVSGAAFAQATISGVVNVDSQNTMAASANRVVMGDFVVKFGVTEDLGGGLTVAASTTLQGESGRGNEVAGNGWSFAVGGGFGKLTLKNYLNANNNISAGVSAEDDMNDVIGSYTFRTRVQYDLPTFAEGFSASLRIDETQAATALDDKPAQVDLGSTLKYQLGYATGPMSVDVYGDQDDGLGLVIASYDAGVAKVGFAYQDVDSQMEATVVAPLGAVTAGFHLIDSDTTEAYGFRVTYALSKRSNVSFNYVDSTKGAKTGTNYRVRMSHSF